MGWCPPSWRWRSFPRWQGREQFGAAGCRSQLAMERHFGDAQGNIRADWAVVAAEVIFHADSGRPKGWGTVRFSKPEEAADAVARFGGVELAGRPMTVMMDRFN